MEAADQERLRLAGLLTPRMTPYIPHVPTPKQHAGLLLPQREVMYGGAAGGGKSDWLLMGALQYVDVPGYSALLLRRTFKELELEGGLLERAWEWLAKTDAVPHDGGMRWTFGDEEKGSVLQFGYLDGPNDHLRYQGSNWQYIGFDELTHFREKQYRYLFSRLRRPKVADETPDWKRKQIEDLGNIPLRMRAASNPGGPGHEWVKSRFGIYWDEDDDREQVPRHCHRPEFVRENDRAFLPATLRDNPHLDREEYLRSLSELDELTQRQLELGDWDAKEAGEYFRREWFEVVDVVPEGCRFARYWDFAATEPSEKNTDPDYTVGLRMGKHPNGYWYVVDVVRMRKRSDAVETAARATADKDGVKTTVWLEQEPGASGKAIILHWQRTVLPEYEVRGNAPSDSKGVRARPVASKAEAGLVKVLRGPWNGDFFDELEAFAPDADDAPEVHDDQVDGLSGAFTVLSKSGPVKREKYMGTTTEPVVQDGDLKLKGERYIDKK